jgi:transposase
LFDLGTNEGGRPAEASEPPRIGPKRLRHAVRNQVELQQCSLDELLPEEHEARIVWEYVCGLDLSELRQRIQAVEGGPGQAPADPRILVALWLYATLRSVGSARELNRLCQYHAAYRWICGGVSMNYHTLADFRTQHVELLDRLLTESVASLMAEGLVSLDRVAQDGMKVRASAGAASFRRQATLAEALVEAENQLARLREELEANPAANKTRQQAARQRAAEERAETCNWRRPPIRKSLPAWT